jgi:hypothetical protein
VAKGKKKDKDEGIAGKAVALVEPGKGKKKDKGKKKEGGKGGFEALSKLADHPLVSELLAVGAIAAVGVIAEHRKLGELESSSAKAVRSAGKAAASAIGVRLMKEFSSGAGARKAPENKKP